MKARSVTRGHGLLEGFLAGKRRRRADALIPDESRAGRLLDIGCGSYPVFLLGTRFNERYGLDRVAPVDLSDAGMTLVAHDVADGSGLPFERGFFDVVTMLAVFEHLEPAVLARLLREIHRVLRPGGAYVMTTPARWTEEILKLMASLRLVSQEEVSEHKATYLSREIGSLLVEAGFDAGRIRQGSFEAGMNLWAVAEKSG